MHRYYFIHNQAFTVSDWLQLLLVVATFSAVFVALFHDSIRDRFRRSKISYYGKASHMQGQDKLGADYKLHYLRLILKNFGYEAREVEVNVLRIQEDIKKGSTFRNNFLVVPLNWTHGAIYDISGVVRNIQKNQTAYLDICSGPIDYKSLHLCTGVSGNADFKDLKPGRTVLTLSLFQKSGQTLYMVIEIKWEKGSMPTIEFIKTQTVAPDGFF